MVTKEDYESQAKAQLDRLTLELHSIHDLQTMQIKKKVLKKLFLSVTDLMIEYHLFLEKQPEMKKEPSDGLVLCANNLKGELERLFQIEGAIDLIVEIEKDSYLKLTLVEESLNR